MKKTMKKLVAVVETVAICCSMAIPVVANAETCSPHDYEYKFVKEIFGGSYEHEYIYSIEEENGQPVIVYKPCLVDVWVKEYENKCTKCEMVESTKYEETHKHRVTHS